MANKNSITDIMAFLPYNDFSLRGCDWKPQRTSRVLRGMGSQAVDMEMYKISPDTACPFLPVPSAILLKTKKEFPLVNQATVRLTQSYGFSVSFSALVPSSFTFTSKN